MTPTIRRLPVLFTIALSLLLGLVACDKKEDAAHADEKAQKTETAPAETTPAETADEAPAAGRANPAVDLASGAVRTIAVDQLANDGSCIGEKDPMCPDTAAPAPCGDYEVAPITVEAFLADPDAHRGKQVAVQGQLDTPGGVACTERGCANQCCNTCSASLYLRTPGSTGMAQTVGFEWSDPGAPNAMQCTGDESGMCCATAVAPTATVVVEGLAVAQGMDSLALSDPTVCVWP